MNVPYDLEGGSWYKCQPCGVCLQGYVRRGGGRGRGRGRGGYGRGDSKHAAGGGAYAGYDQQQPQLNGAAAGEYAADSAYGRR